MRNFKALGLALVAVFAMSAVVASSASATAFTSVKYPQHLIGEDTGAPDVFTVSGNELTCTDETFTSDITAQSTTLNFIPSYVNCKTAGAAFNNVTVTTNGCTFTFDAHGHSVIDCPTTPAQQQQAHKQHGPIEIHHYSNQGHTTVSCTNTVGPQNISGTVTYTNDPDGTVTVNGTPQVNLQTHGGCSFGFTINVVSTYDLSVKVRATSGEKIDVGT